LKLNETGKTNYIKSKFEFALFRVLHGTTDTSLHEKVIAVQSCSTPAQLSNCMLSSIQSWSRLCGHVQSCGRLLVRLLCAINRFARSTDRAALAMDLSAAQQSIDHAARLEDGHFSPVYISISPFGHAEMPVQHTTIKGSAGTVF